LLIAKGAAPGGGRLVAKGTAYVRRRPLVEKGGAYVRRGLLVAILLGAFPAASIAAPVVVLGHSGHVVRRDDPFLTTPALPPTPSRTPMTALRAAPMAPLRAVIADRTVGGELARLLAQHAITPAGYRRYRAGFDAALRAVRRLRGTRATELQAVIGNLHAIAAGGQLTVSRLPVLFETLRRNLQWWTTASLPSSGQRIEFAGSELVWEYYAGQGIELQELGSFGKADGLYAAGASKYPQMRRLLAELIPFGAIRGGGLTWEYYFNFDGGSPPWTSAISQGTALEALTRAYKAFGDRSYLAIARRALPVFAAAAPVGVSVRTSLGARYLLYSFAPAPGSAVINGFLQSLIGLYDYAQASHNAHAARLFALGDAEAQADVPRYDTGAWSLYQPGQEDTLDYHKLVTGFLHELCARTHARVYCTTAGHFDHYLQTVPSIDLLTHRVQAGRPGSIAFRLSKYSHVGIVVQGHGQTALFTSGYFPYGESRVSLPPLTHRGKYTVRLAATDLAGNFHRTVATLQAS